MSTKIYTLTKFDEDSDFYRARREIVFCKRFIECILPDAGSPVELVVSTKALKGSKAVCIRYEKLTAHSRVNDQWFPLMNCHTDKLVEVDNPKKVYVKVTNQQLEEVK